MSRLVLIAAGLALAVGEAGAEAPPAARITRVAATAQSLRVSIAAPQGARLRLVELRPYQEYRPDAGLPVAWEGRVSAAPVEIPRFAGARDRLYAKLQLVEPATGQALGAPHYATDLSAVGAETFDFPWPKSIKGITCPVDLDDVVALGVKYVNTNVSLPSMFDWGNAKPEETWDVDGERFPINLAYFKGLDREVKRLTDAGINVTVVLNNPVPTKPDPANPLIHPGTDLAGAPNHLGAFNLTDERGFRAYRAAIEYLARRYSRPDRKYGWISGYIVGNELQAHWEWWNIGRRPADEVIREYLRALRVTDLAVRRFHAKARVYVSMDHHWSLLDGNPLQRLRGDVLLERLNAWGKEEGDFPWDVAFHPYPENLFNPRSWTDRTATLGFDTKRITFKNLEVLPAFLRQKEMLCDGKPRRVILSEQGFDSSRAGEEVQAAGYAYGYYRAGHIPGIDAFMLHRHADHAGEGGLLLGLWTFAPGTVTTPGRKKRIWEVFRQADTPGWEQAFAFAKPIIGIDSWSELDPAKEIGPVSPPPAPPKPLVCRPDRPLELAGEYHQAQCRNCLDWRPSEVEVAGVKRPSIFHHPPAEGDGDATFRIVLPALPAGRRLEFTFATAFTGATANGAHFTVLVDGKEAWSAVQTTLPAIERSVELTPWAGKTVSLTLRVNALGDTQYDWCNWVAPAVGVR